MSWKRQSMHGVVEQLNPREGTTAARDFEQRQGPGRPGSKQPRRIRKTLRRAASRRARASRKANRP